MLWGVLVTTALASATVITRDMPSGRGLDDRDIPSGRGLDDRHMPSGRGLDDRDMPSGRGLDDRDMPSGRGLDDERLQLNNTDSLKMPEEEIVLSKWNLTLERAKGQSCEKAGGKCMLKKTVKKICKGKVDRKSKCAKKNEICCISGAIATKTPTTQAPTSKAPTTRAPITMVPVTSTSEAPITSPLCPSPYTHRGNECFFVSEDENDLLNWDEARDRCLRMGGDLAQPQDMVDFVNYITESYPNNKPIIWIGATDRAVEQDWYWLSGEPVPPALWKSSPFNQPSGDGDCMDIHNWSTLFYMNDIACHAKGYFACEMAILPTKVTINQCVGDGEDNSILWDKVDSAETAIIMTVNDGNNNVRGAIENEIQCVKENISIANSKLEDALGIVFTKLEDKLDIVKAKLEEKLEIVKVKQEEEMEIVKAKLDFIIENLECTDNFSRLNSECFLVVKEELTWDKARTYCQRKGADLAQPKDLTALKSFLAKRELPDPGDYYWIGGSDADIEGTWNWLDGTRITNGWGRGEPNDANNNEDCLLYVPKNDPNSLNDEKCTNTRMFICEQ